MRRSRRPIRSAAAAVAALSLIAAACGGDDDDGGDATETTDGGGADSSAVGEPDNTGDAASAPDNTGTGNTSGGATDGGGDGGAGSGETIELTITANAIRDGKNTEDATFIEDWAIPEFVKAQEAKGVDVEVSFQSNGIDDEQYKQKVALDLRSDAAGDILYIDSIWLGEFAEAGYLQPLDEIEPSIDQWEGWKQIPETVQQLGMFDDQRYAIPGGTDGRVLFYNKELFAEAGLPEDWQPKSWQEILDACEQLKEVVDIPIQLNAGTAMGEATTMQGLLPILAGAGGEVYADDKWQGDTQAMQDALTFYEEIYSNEYGDPILQQEADGRDVSFEQFANGEIAILAEGDYLWRGVVDPEVGIAPMENRDDVVGYALIPAKEPGAGINGQDFVSMSGGYVRTVNPKSAHPEVAMELLEFMNSAEAFKKTTDFGVASITPRNDVNEQILASDPLMTFIAEKVLPITGFRPSLELYPQVSTALQEATVEVVNGTSGVDAAAAYEGKLAEIVGADNVVN